LPTIQETAYPRLKSHVSARDLATIYTPNLDELVLAKQVTRGAVARLGFLVLLKIFQRLGYFVPVSQVPTAIIEHIAGVAEVQQAITELAGYDLSGTRKRHLQMIRQTLHINGYDKNARHVLLLAMSQAARTKEALADLINIGIEELIRKKYELPAFDTLVRAARHARAVLYRQFYHQVDARLSAEEKNRIETLFIAEPESRFTPWNTLKQEPGRPSLMHLNVWLDRQAWLAHYQIGQQALAEIPEVKIQHFAAEARTLDAARMLEIEPQKRLTLAVSLLKVQSTRVLDDLAEMFIKRMAIIHKKGKEALVAYHSRNQRRADELVQTLHDLVIAYRTEGSAQDKIAAIEDLLADQADVILQRCEDHIAHAGDNYFVFLWRFYKRYRSTLFRLLKRITIRTTTQDTRFVAALNFLLAHEQKTGEWLTAPQKPCLDLSWMSEAWWRLVTEQRNRDATPKRLHRRYFELCVFSQLMTELKSGDLCIPGSNLYADYRDQLISWEAYDQDIAGYGLFLPIPSKR
jgi:hypothetical protein